eukprot:GHVR01168964.1.p1 GENE.GHVR01168964.1~~GHVR01168964.1.p1  ORF type:complete len:111 (-),score=9.81 GHVR01168964.1:47-379(-)
MKTDLFYQFQDYCASWVEKVKQIEKTKQIIYIIKEIDLFKSLFAVLKSLSSGILEKDHWKVFWNIIKSDKYMAPESIKLGDVLNQGRVILEKLLGIQDLISRAQGESTLR